MLNTVKTTSIVRATTNGIVLGLVKNNVAKAVFFPRGGGWFDPTGDVMAAGDPITPNPQRHGERWDLTDLQGKAIEFHMADGWSIMREFPREAAETTARELPRETEV